MINRVRENNQAEAETMKERSYDSPQGKVSY